MMWRAALAAFLTAALSLFALNAPHAQFNGCSAGFCSPPATSGGGGSCNPPLLSCVTVPSGLSLWYPLDTSTTSGSTTNDLSGNAVNGTLMNSPSIVTAQIQQGVSLNGTNQYVQLPSTAHFIADGSSGAYSITAWFNINSVTDAMIIDNDIMGGECVAVRPNRSGSGVFNFINGSGNNLGSATTVTSVVGTWTFIAVTWDATTSRIYINGSGTPDASGASSGATCGQTAFAIGADPANSSNFFPGKIDDVRGYGGRAITGAEVTNIYNAGHAGNP
jgi:hypothetical protein